MRIHEKIWPLAGIELRLEVAQFRVNAGWNSNICDVVNPGPPLFRWFLTRNSHIPKFLELLVLFHLGTHYKWNYHVGWLTDAHFLPIFSTYVFKSVFSSFCDVISELELINYRVPNTNIRISLSQFPWNNHCTVIRSEVASGLTIYPTEITKKAKT